MHMSHKQNITLKHYAKSLNNAILQRDRILQIKLAIQDIGLFHNL